MNHWPDSLRERTQINKIRNERELITDTTEIQRIIQEHSKRLCNTKLGNLKKGNLDSFSRLNRGEWENLSRPITGKEIQKVTKVPPQNKSSGQDGFTSDFYKTFKGDGIRILKLFQHIEVKAVLSNSFNQSNATLILKPGKNITHQKKIIGQDLWWTSMQKSTPKL